MGRSTGLPSGDECEHQCCTPPGSLCLSPPNSWHFSKLASHTLQVIPFPQMELQAKWIARALSGRVTLPTREAS